MKKNYYIGILDASIKDDTIKFVYELDHANKVAKWATFDEIRKQGKKPLKFKTKAQAENLQFGLCMNFYFAVLVTTCVDIQ